MSDSRCICDPQYGHGSDAGCTWDPFAAKGPLTRRPRPIEQDLTDETSLTDGYFLFLTCDILEHLGILTVGELKKRYEHIERELLYGTCSLRENDEYHTRRVMRILTDIREGLVYGGQAEFVAEIEKRKISWDLEDLLGKI